MPEWLKAVLSKFTDGRRAVERGFFALWFKTTDEDYTNAEYVDIDVERTTDTVAPTLRDGRTGSVIVKRDSWKENKFRPPLTALEDPIDLYGLMRRQPGESDDARTIGDWFGRLASKIVDALSRFHRMIGLQVDLQCAQIMQTGAVELRDNKDGVSYTLNFGADQSHFPTVAVDWDDVANATPVDDVTALADKIADDGQVAPAYLILGADAYRNLLKNTEFQNLVRKDGLGLGELTPTSMRSRGGKYHGYAEFGSHTLEIWTYGGSYKRVGSNSSFKYLDDNAAIVIARPEDVDFRTVYGGVPSLGMKEPFNEIVPSTVTYSGDRGTEGTGFIRVHNRVYEDKKGDTYTAECKARPLSIPVSIDRFGCLNTKNS